MLAAITSPTSTPAPKAKQPRLYLSAKSQATFAERIPKAHICLLQLCRYAGGGSILPKRSTAAKRAWWQPEPSFYLEGELIVK